MSAWWLLQIFVNVAMAVGISILWIRLRRPPQDDPRLSRGLQLLQSKIAVLEDLSDRTDAQVKQLSSLIEQKARLLQNKIIESEHQIQRVDQAMKRSKEVAEIFQDKIPHQEILERQNTIKYVQAAQMAHSGKSVEEIALVVDLPKDQIELIAKLNREEMVFDVDALPEWAKAALPQGATAGFIEDAESDIAGGEVTFQAGDYPVSHEAEIHGELSELFSPPKEEYASLKRLGEEFRSAVQSYETKKAILDAAEAKSNEPSVLMEGAKKVTSKLVASANGFLNQVESRAKDLIDGASAPTAQTKTESDIKKVVFPKVDINNELG